MERRTVTFSGQVQGVGFRYTACRAAGGYRITGYVRNLPDGRVRVVAEGAGGEIDAFLSDLSARMAGYIRTMEQSTDPAEGRFMDFGVQF